MCTFINFVSAIFYFIWNLLVAYLKRSFFVTISDMFLAYLIKKLSHLVGAFGVSVRSHLGATEVHGQLVGADVFQKGGLPLARVATEDLDFLDCVFVQERPHNWKRNRKYARSCQQNSRFVFAPFWQQQNNTIDYVAGFQNLGVVCFVHMH